MAGAESFKINLGHWRSTLTFKGASLPSHQLKEPLEHLFSSPASGVEWALHELAIGLQSAARGGVYKVAVSQGDLSVSIKGDRVRCYQEQSEFSDELRFLIFHRRTVGGFLSNLIRGRQVDEFSVLKENLVVGRGLGRVKCGGASFEVSRFVQLTPQAVGVESPLAHVVVPGGWVCLGVDGQLGKGKDSRLVLVVRGRRLQVPLKLGRAQVVACMESYDLHMDISQSAPVRNRNYLEIHRLVNESLLKLQQQALKNRESSLEARDKRILGRQLCRSYRTSGRLQEALILLEEFPLDDSRRAAIHFLMGNLEEAESALNEELNEPDLPPGLRPSRLSDLAMVKAFTDPSRALELWLESHRLVVQQHMERKPHLVSASLEELLSWWPLVDRQNEKAWGLFRKKFSAMVPWLEEQGSPSVWKLWEAAESKKRHLGDSHPRQAGTLEIGSWLKLLECDYEMSHELATRAGVIRKECYGPSNPILGRSHALRCLSLLESDSAKAVSLARSRLELMSGLYGEEHPEVGASFGLLAVADSTNRASHLKQSARLLKKAGIEQSDESPIVCFRGWFHSRSPWGCRMPLRALNIDGAPSGLFRSSLRSE